MLCLLRFHSLSNLCSEYLPDLFLTPGGPLYLTEEEGELEVERRGMTIGKGPAPTIGQVWSREGLEWAEDEDDNADSQGDEDAGMGAAGLDLMGFTRRPAKRSAQPGTSMSCVPPGECLHASWAAMGLLFIGASPPCILAHAQPMNRYWP